MRDVAYGAGSPLSKQDPLPLYNWRAKDGSCFFSSFSIYQQGAAITKLNIGINESPVIFHCYTVKLVAMERCILICFPSVGFSAIRNAKIEYE